MKIDYQIEQANFLSTIGAVTGLGLLNLAYVTPPLTEKLALIGSGLGLFLFLYEGYKSFSLMKIRSQENPEEGIQFKVVQ